MILIEIKILNKKTRYFRIEYKKYSIKNYYISNGNNITPLLYLSRMILKFVMAEYCRSIKFISTELLSKII